MSDFFMRTFVDVTARKAEQRWRDIKHPCTPAGIKWREESYRISQELKHPIEPTIEELIERIDEIERKSPPGRKEMDSLKGEIRNTRTKLLEHIAFKKKKELYTIEGGGEH